MNKNIDKNKIIIDLDKLNDICTSNFVSHHLTEKIISLILLIISFMVFLLSIWELSISQLLNILSIPDSWNFISALISLLFMMYFYYLIEYLAYRPKDIRKINLKSTINLLEYLSVNSLNLFTEEVKANSSNNLNDKTLFKSLYQDPYLGWFWKEIKLYENNEFKNDLDRINIANSNNREQILNEAFNIAHQNSFTHIEPECIILALSKINYEIQQLFLKYDINLDDISAIVTSTIYQRDRLETEWNTNTPLNSLNTSNLELTSLPTPNLNKYSTDLTILAKEQKLVRLVGREDIVAESLKILEKDVKGNILIAGESGVGKTSLVEELIIRLTTKEVPINLRHKRVVLFKYEELIAESKTAEIFEQKFAEIIEEIIKAKNIILFLDNIEKFITSEISLESNILNSLINPLSRNSLQIIATTSEKAFKKYFEKNTILTDSLTVVHLAEADINTSIKICEIISRQLEKAHNTEITYDAISAIVNLSSKYIYDKYLPRKAINILENIVSEYSSSSIIDANIVKEYLTKLTSIPLTSISEEESKKLENLESLLHTNIISQEDAVAAIANAIRRSRSGLINEKRPISSFLFYGPTGVGKTETAKTLARAYFGDEKKMLRFDMSEYQNPDSIDTLIRNITDEVKHSPFSLLLFDEFEKADKKIINIMLQILDDARLTNNENETINFSNTIIICTSNAGSQDIYEALKNNTPIEEIKEKTQKSLLSYFAPELLNRFDEIIMFKPLTEENLINIGRIILNEVESSLEHKHYKIVFNDSIIKEIISKIDDKSFGARPIRRTVETSIENPLAEAIIKQTLPKNSLVEISSIEDIKKYL